VAGLETSLNDAREALPNEIDAAATDVAAARDAVQSGKVTGFDAALLDIDNGPSALTSHRNGALYADRGIAAARAALKPAGILAVWSSFADQQFARRLRNGGLDVVMERVRGRPRRGPNHVIYLAQRPDGRAHAGARARS